MSELCHRLASCVGRGLPLAVVALAVAPAWAVPVAAINPGFDFTTVGNGTGVNSVAGTVSPSQSFTNNVGNPGNGFKQTFNDFVTNGSAVFAGWTTTFSAGAGNQSNFYFPPTGAFAYLNSGNSGTNSLTQTVAGALDPNTEYTMTVDTYARFDPPAVAGDVLFQLRTGGGVSLGGVIVFVAPTQIGSGPAANSPGSIKLTVTTGGSVVPMSDLQIYIENHGSKDAQLVIDNLSIETARVVPEPASMLLLPAAGMLLVRRRAR